jgi:glycosyltransferase involved in cell wall biosynthesis
VALLKYPEVDIDIAVTYGDELKIQRISADQIEDCENLDAALQRLQPPKEEISECLDHKFYNIVHIHSHCEDEALNQCIDFARREYDSKIISTLHIIYPSQMLMEARMLIEEQLYKACDEIRIGANVADIMFEANLTPLLARLTKLLRQYSPNISFQKIALFKSHFLIFLTEYGSLQARSFFGNYLENKEFAILGNGCRNSNGSEQPLYKPLNLAEQVRLLFIGRLSIEKGIRELCQAYRKIWSVFSNVTLQIHGDPPEKDHPLLTEIKSYLGPSQLDVEFIPWDGPYIDPETGEELVGGETIKDVLLKNAHALLVPSYSETFSIAALEAMLKKVIVLLSDIPTLRELYLDKGLAIPVRSRDPDSIFSAVKELLMSQGGKNPHDVLDMVERAYKFALQNTWDQVAEKLFYIYRALLPRPSSLLLPLNPR